jgi:hypothetical protein
MRGNLAFVEPGGKLSLGAYLPQRTSPMASFPSSSRFPKPSAEQAAEDEPVAMGRQLHLS